ncbi:MAG: ribosome assembly RNA-binding protein YhbY [Clostridia bacterium]|nr:ribosome assembly RNA-binding protein YhbY [Clostridia bacterium]
MLTSKQRAKLRSMASTMDTIMQIGKSGITDALVKTVSDALEARELIKLRVLENCDLGVRGAAEELAARTGAEMVAVIGTKCILYRESQTKKTIEL